MESVLWEDKNGSRERRVAVHLVQVSDVSVWTGMVTGEMERSEQIQDIFWK